MKLISLNIWGGKAFAPLMEFIERSADGTDIFCFQEVFHSPSGATESHGARMNILDEVSAALPDFACYFSPLQDRFDIEGPVDFDVSLGQATFVRKTMEVESEGSVFVYRERNGGLDITNIPTSVQYLRFIANGKRFTVCNFHGIAFPGDKLDNQDRLEQSRRIKNFVDGERGAKILCGDFNLLPDNKSIVILEENMVNLIKKYNVRETRGKLLVYYGKPDAQHFADYMFVSPDVRVLNFKVPDAGVSDHLPMILEFE
jgi:hypothetical protein